jgi:thiamine transporter ThiT
MEEDVRVYKIALSAVGGLLIGFLGLLAGTAWERALGKSDSRLAWKVAGLAGLWGMTVVQLTPTGGVIMENKATVNYAVFALHGWISFFASVLAGCVWLGRTVTRRRVRK